MKYILISLFLSFGFSSFSQEVDITNLKEVVPEKSFENVTVKKLHSDENSSYFVIWIKKDVASHKHADHSEGIIVLAGEAEMTIAENSFKVKEGDHFVIPKNTFHSVKVTSKDPLKVVSVQAPKFEGKDRIFEKEKNGSY
ncbi:MAG: cupin domain-containing protein [Flavobacteriales bacterium]|nr:cupin domain-containing protein [Flavobacteriales bacterium]MCB9334910.1 cupin domain-containing protein [Flavobacteriales bacterium]